MLPADAVAQNILSIQVPAAQLVQYTQLHTTCSQLLPVEPLLRAVIACNSSSAGAQPTFSIESGSCTTTNGGTCLRSPNFDPLERQHVRRNHLNLTSLLNHVCARRLFSLTFRLWRADDNGEECTVRMKNAASLSFTTFETEAVHDFLRIGDDPEGGYGIGDDPEESYSGNTGPTEVLVSPDSVITWTTDGSAVNIGFEVCATTP